MNRFPQQFADRFARRYLPAGTTTRGENQHTARDLAYDMMLEVQGLIRSLALRTTLDRDLRVDETFMLHGREWVVERVAPVAAADFDRRLVAREIESKQSPIAA